MNFFTTDSETELRPREDQEVLRLEVVLGAARELAEPASRAWRDYCAAHCDEVTRFPFPRDKQRLYDQLQDTSEAVTAAEAAYKVALDAATQRATAAWDDIIRQQFLDDLTIIEAFIELLAKYEATVIEAQAAGVSHTLHVPRVFLTATEVAGRLAYAKKALSVE